MVYIIYKCDVTRHYINIVDYNQYWMIIVPPRLCLLIVEHTTNPFNAPKMMSLFVYIYIYIYIYIYLQTLYNMYIM
jgi:hypothetical protein